MNAQQMMLAFSGLIIFIFVSGMIVGFIRGFKKTTYKVIVTVIFYLIFFLTLDVVATRIIELPLIDYLRQANVSLPPEIGDASTIKEACEAFLLSQGVESSEIVVVAMSFAMTIGKLIYALIYSTLICFIYWIITSIVWLFIRPLFGKDYKKVKVKQKQIDTLSDPTYKVITKKKSKHRLLGGLMGGFKKIPQALMIIVVTSGIIAMIPQFDDSSSNTNKLSVDINDDALKEFIEKYNLGEYVKFVDMYRNSIYVKTLENIKIKDQTIDSLLFKKLTNGVYEDYVLDFQSEMAFMLNTGLKTLVITDGNFDLNSLNASQQTELCELLKDLTDSNLIMSLIPIGASVALSLDMIKEQLPEGLELDPSIFNNVNWEEDIYNIADAGKELIALSGGFQHLDKLDFFNMDTTTVKTLTTILSNIGLLLNVTPVLVDYVLTLPEVVEQVGDLAIDLEKVIWSDEIVNLGDIYEDFANVGLQSFNDLLGQFDNFADEQFDATKTLIASVFESEFISQAFPAAVTLVMDKQPTNIQQLFTDVKITEWENEFNTVVDIARDIKNNGGSIAEFDLNILRNVRVETLTNSNLLTGAFINLFRFSDDPNSLGGSMGLNEFVYVPNEYKQSFDAWLDTTIDGKKHPGELTKILTSMQNILLTMPEDVNDFSMLPNYILQIDDKYLTGENSIFASEVLKASISNYIEKTPSIKENIVIPLSATKPVDNIRVIKQTELEQMVKGIKALGIKDFNNITLTQDMIDNLIINPGESDEDSTNLDTILSSKIVNATFSKMILDQSEGSLLVIPSEVIVSEENINYINQEEMKNLIRAVLMLDIDITNPNVTPQALFNLVDNETNYRLNKMLESKTLHASISNILLNSDVSSAIKVPQELVSEDNGVKYVDKDELANMMISIKSLDPNLQSFDSLNVDVKELISRNDSELHNLFASATIRNTVTDLVRQGNILIPNVAYDSAFSQTKIISSDELVKIIKVIGPNGLNLGDFTSIEVNPVSLTDAQLNVILDSNIAYYNVSKLIVDKSNLVIVKDVITVISNQDFMTKDEIKKIINILKSINLSDIKVNDNAIESLLNIKDSNVQNMIANTLTVRATLSSYIDYDKLPITLPTEEFINYKTNEVIKVITEEGMKQYFLFVSSGM